MFSTFRIYILIASVVLFACHKTAEDANNNGTTEQHTTTPLQNSHPTVNMVYIPGGEYKPFYGSDTALVQVPPFLIDERAVTNEEFLAFVKANPQWQRSRVKQVYADSNYLKLWPGDTTLPNNADPAAPVCDISWFAAKAYAKSVGKRLPTLDEWEFVAMADEKVANARKTPEYSNRIVDLYLQKDRQFKAVKKTAPNYWGVYNMFDLIWEWTDDFNSVMATEDSRVGEYDDKGLFCAGSATSATDVLNYAAFMRFALRGSLKANYTVANLGFRCAKDSNALAANKK